MIIHGRSSAAVLALIACSSSPAEPGPIAGPLEIEAAIGQAALVVGDTAQLVFRLVNSSDRPVTLTFGSSCQIMPYIRLAGSGQVFYPNGGDWFCLAVVTQLIVSARGAHVVRLTVRGGPPQSASLPGVPLGVGRYEATAVVNAGEYQLRSKPVAFTVR